MRRTRVVWLDLLRGFGISLVVIGHCLQGGLLRTWIYNFHVPLLFMLSGYLNQLLHGGTRRFRFKRVLLPYVIWSALSAGFAILYTPDRGAFWIVNDMMPLVGFSSWNLAMWFLYALLFVDVLKPKWDRMSGYVPLVVFLSVPIGVQFLYPEIPNALGWKNILFGCLCYGIGEMIARFSIVEKLSSYRAMPIMLLIIGSFIGLYNGPLSTYMCAYGRSIIFLFIASTMISVALMILFRRFEQRIPVVFGLLGKCSLFIMVSHYFPFRTCANIIPMFVPLNNICVQLVEGVLILVAYVGYFKVIEHLKVGKHLPDYLGGSKR